LRYPAFQRLWLGLSISYLGDQFTIIALLWFVLQLTGSGAAVGLVILCFDLPGVVTGARSHHVAEQGVSQATIQREILSENLVIKPWPRGSFSEVLFRLNLRCRVEEA
jgi:hypothetical protein